MGILNLFKRKRIKKNYLLALDIGTEFVKALIFKPNKAKRRGFVLGIGRQRQNPFHMQAGAVSDIDGVVLACQAAIEKAVAMAGGRPQEVIMGIAGELVKGSTTSFIYKRPRPHEKIDLPELKNIIQKIQWKAFDQVRSQLAEQTGRSEIEIKLINALITDIRIDGYQITNPLGFQGRQVYLSIFNVYAPLIHLGALQTIASNLDLDLLSIAAEPYAIARCSDIKSDSGAIFIDIGGGTTDVALVRRSGVEETKSLALAGRAFTKRLAQKLGASLEEAETIKIKYAKRQLSPVATRRIREILKKDIEIWLAGVELVLEEFDQKEALPCSVLLCGGGSLLPEMERILSKGTIKNQWQSKFPFAHPLRVSFIQSKNICDMTDQTGKLEGPAYIMPLALASLGLSLVTEKENILSSTLRRTVKMMQR